VRPSSLVSRCRVHESFEGLLGMDGGIQKNRYLWLCELELCLSGKEADRGLAMVMRSDNRVWSRLRSKRFGSQPIANLLCTPPVLPHLHAHHLYLHIGAFHLHTHNYLFSISDLIHDFSSLVHLFYIWRTTTWRRLCIQDSCCLLLLALELQVSHKLSA
jgi:hypothetical protein